MNWVLVFAGLLPLWAALFIVFTNMRVLKEEDPLIEPVPFRAEKPMELEFTDEKTSEPKSLFKGLLNRLKKEKSDKPEEEIDFTEPRNNDQPVSLGLPKGIKRLWGVTFVLIFLACLVYGSDKALVYIFKEYRWVIGTTNPWTAQLEFASVSTSAIAGLSAMLATLRTGIYLLRN
ncbi:hypothetical protein IH574_03715 [Candidatus Bathyarchaeota archaeon]|nr:hypothetical protein [Candidatus Bathyarchaeota archaeon]